MVTKTTRGTENIYIPQKQPTTVKEAGTMTGHKKFKQESRRPFTTHGVKTFKNLLRGAGEEKQPFSF